KLYLPIAAAACLLVFFGLFLFRGGDHALYELPQMQSEIVRGQAGDVSYEDAVKAFNNKSYGEARTMLNGLIASDSTVVQYQYYAALTYFGEEDWPSTIRELTAIAQGKSVFADEAKYYLAVAYWKSGETTKAIELANQIPDIGKLGEKTRKLLGEME
ncbi:MAG TPA: hypothetical protein PKA53_13285, partial [Sphingobacterium sp.]|nr:hypothetical protein [Sphingobacterium sp.]